MTRVSGQSPGPAAAAPPPTPFARARSPGAAAGTASPRLEEPKVPPPLPPPPAPAPHQFVLWEEGRAGKRERHVTTLPSAPHGAPSLSKANIPNVSRLSGNNKAA